MIQSQSINSSNSLSPPTSPTISENSTFTPHFVQALHDYLPTSTTEESCLYFKKGSIIEVFNRDDSGWWDGQCGEIRGWFPSNYVGRIGDLKRTSSDYYYEEEEVDNLDFKMGYHFNNSSHVSLDDYSTKIASIQSRVEMARALLRDDRRKSENTDIHSFIEQVNKRIVNLMDACNQQQPNAQSLNSQLTASVRTVLLEANIVNKDSPLLKLYPELSRQRHIILNALSRLVLKSKKIQQSEQVLDEEKEQLSHLANQLINEMDILEKILITIPRQSLSSEGSTRPPSSMFDHTPRSSISSLGYSSVTSGASFRQYMNEVRHSSFSGSHTAGTSLLVSKNINVFDKETILQNIMDHQTCIDEFMASLVMTLERYLSNRHRATEILEITRKAMESVMTFLAVVEHVCSNIDDLDYSRRISMIPKDPLLVSLVITKESVYSAITNLVTAVRALTASQQDTIVKEDYDHLCSCCDVVVKSTNECAACIRAFLQKDNDSLQDSMQETTLKHEFSIENGGQLSSLERKLTTLTMIQQCLDEQNQSVLVEEEEVPPTDQIVEDLNVLNAPKHDDIMDVPLSKTSSLESSNSVSAVESIIPETNPIKQTKMRPRAASISSTNSFHHLPPIPPNNIMKHTVSSATSLNDDLNKTKDQPTARRSRGVSISSLRSSLGKSSIKSDKSSHSSESLSSDPSLKKLPSWMSTQTLVENRTDIETMTTNQLVMSKKEPEYFFLKQSAFTENELILNAEGEVTGATVEALVRKLTLHEKSPDLNFTRAFFYNFRLFTNPAEFVKLLIERFTLQPPNSLTEEQSVIWTNRVLIPIRLRVYNVIKTWLETYFSFEQDAYVEETLSNFASNEMSKAMPGPAKRMTELISRTFNSKDSSRAGRKHTFADARMAMQKSGLTQIQSSLSGNHLFSNITLFEDHVDTDKFPQPIINKSLRNILKKSLIQNTTHTIHVNDIDPIELARQLTLMENNLFCQIRANELIGQEFKKKVGTSQAIHVKAMIQKSTQVTSWISDTILSEVDVKKRAQVLKYWIKVGDACLQLNNYNTLMAIRSALDSTSIIRLKKTWDYMSVKYKSMWEIIYRATDSQRNFADYRQRLKITIAPCLPFLGVYLTDLTFIDDGNMDYRTSIDGSQLINFDKYAKITRVLNEIDQFQISYKLAEVQEIQKYLKIVLEGIEQDDQVYYKKSLQREPKEEEFTA